MNGTRARLPLGLGLLGWLWLCACDDHSPQLCDPALPAGRIEGVVRTGSVAPDAIVRATRVGGAPGELAAFETGVGSDGAFRLDVPAGRFVVGLRFGTSATLAYQYSAAGPRHGDAPPDTLTVKQQASQSGVDFDLASLHLHMDLSEDLNGDTGLVNLYRSPGSPGVASETAVRHGGKTITDAMLDCDLVGILPGRYKVEVVAGYRAYACNCTYDGEHLWIPGVRDSADASWIDVVAGQRSEVAAQASAERARIQGHIRGAWQEFGISPPSLALFAPDGTVVRGLQPAGSDGSFAASLYLPGPVKLLVSDSGVEQWIGGAQFTDATVFTLESGRTISGVEYVESGLFLELTAPGTDVWQTRFQLYDAATMTLAAEWLNADSPRTVSGFPNLRPGTYRMHIEAGLPGYEVYAPQWYDRAVAAANATSITIARAGDIVPVPVTLEKGGSVSGRIVEAPGVQADYYLYVTNAADPAVWARVGGYRRNGAVLFVVRGLPDGEWKLGAWARESGDHEPERPPAGTVWYPGAATWGEAGIIPVHDFADVTGIEIQMPAPPR
jgi:hypothetical protein